MIIYLVNLTPSAYIEIVHLVRNYYNAPLNVNIPTLIIQGTKDNVVPISSSEYVFKSVKSKYKCLLIVKGVNHNVFTSKRKEEVTNYIVKFL